MIRKVEKYFKEKGVYQAKHGKGTVVSAGGNIQKQKDIFALSLKTLAANKNSAVKGIMSKVKAAKYSLAFSTGGDLVVDCELSPARKIILDVDSFNNLSSYSDNDLALFYSLTVLTHLCLLSGQSEQDALYNTTLLYDSLKEKEQETIKNILAIPEIDSGKVFTRLLVAAGKKDRHEKQRMVSWFLARERAEVPYNMDRVRRAIKEETSNLENLRNRIYNEIKDTYVESVDENNAIRISDWCMKNGIRLVTGRFSRAFYIDAMSIASAKVLETKQIKPSIDKFKGQYDKAVLKFATPELQKFQKQLRQLGGEAQGVVNLAGREKISLNESKGTIEKFKKQLRTMELSILGKIDELQTEKSDAIASEGPSGKTLKNLQRDRQELANAAKKLNDAVSEVEFSISKALKKDPTFMVFFQRLFPLDVINMGMLNELNDPFFGEDEEIHHLIRSSGHNMYTTSNMSSWLRRCDDWVEALPAYATYEIIPQAGGSYRVTAWVQRIVLEDMYRRYAKDWSKNVKNVIDSEHLAIAREVLAQTSKEKSQDPALVAELGAVVGQTYFNLCNEVGQLMETDGLDRIQALRKVIKENKTENNLVNEIAAEKNAQKAEEKIKELVNRNKLEEKSLELKPFALKPARRIPSVHVLTTLGPGETEINVENWLNETMTLYNVSQAHKLEGQVTKKIDAYQKRIISVGNKVIEEQDLQGEIFNIAQADGLSLDNEAEKNKVILKLISSYPEVSGEVSRICVLQEHNLDGKVDEYLKSHPGIDENAVKQVMANNKLSDAGQVKANPDYVSEKNTIAVSMARQDLIKSNNLADETRTYLRNRLDVEIASIFARREIITENNLLNELNNLAYRYEAAGPAKKYNLIYAPSRVDLGVEEVRSIRNVPKWVGGRDQAAANAGKELYGLYNIAGPQAVNSPRLAEFLKVGENFFSRGGVYYLSLTAGINIDTLGIGDFEFFRDQWNMRGDRIVLPTGETYGGFCVPKEFSLLYAVIIAAVESKTSKTILDNFGIPAAIQPKVIEDLRQLLRMQVDLETHLDWEIKCNEFLTGRYKEYFSILGKPGYIYNLPRIAETLKKSGVITGGDQQDLKLKYEFSYWVNKKAQGLEEINRVGVFRKVHMINGLIKKSRKLNPNVAPDNKIIGVMTASYKEGERKDGKEVPITDVRFSAGSRKMEIYAGTAENHLLKDIDPEGREIITRMMKDFVTPADIRMIGTCTGRDVLNHVPGSGLEAVMEGVKTKLLEAGVSETMIDANSRVYGGDLEKWSGIKEMPAEKRIKLINSIGSKIHLLVLVQRGVTKAYEEAIQGVDFIDLSIPDPELLDLFDNLPKLVYLMKKGKPDSALVLADGTSGGRRRVTSFRYSSSRKKIKELFALDDRLVYGSLGLGEDTVEEWRQEMVLERKNAQALWDAAVVSKDAALAQTLYEKIRQYVIRNNRAEEAAIEESKARNFKVWSPEYRYRSEILSKVAAGLKFSQLDFAAWLVLGGEYIVNGMFTQEEIQQKAAQWAKAVAGSKATASAALITLVNTLVKPKYIPPAEKGFYELESKISGSLKAVEEQVSRLESREVRRKMARRALSLHSRKLKLTETESKTAQFVKNSQFDECYKHGKAILGDGGSKISQESFGEYITWVKAASQVLANLIFPSGAPEKDFVLGKIELALNGGEITLENYRPLVIAITGKSGPVIKDKADLREKVTRALELIDIAFLLEKTLDLDNPTEMVLELARFFDITVNSHIFDCIPYHYYKERGIGFEKLNRDEKIKLSVDRHQWLYAHIQYLFRNHSELKDCSEKVLSLWLGDARKGNPPLGVNVKDKNQQFWFSYVRMRDLSVLKHEGYAYPEVFDNVDPSVIKGEDRTNLVIVYPHGNTTVPVALEQGGKLSEKEDINLFLTAFPEITFEGGRKFLEIRDGFGYVSIEDYKKLLINDGMSESDAAQKAGTFDKKGVLVMIGFNKPMRTHGVFFHFTHPMRTLIDGVKVPLIQPFVWEAATHLKCKLPDMLKGSGTRTAHQANFYKQGIAADPVETKRKIEKLLVEFTKKWETIIAKPEKESGGRNAKILPVRKDGKIVAKNLKEMTDLVYDISLIDNVVIQEVLKSHVRRIYTSEFMEDLVDRFAKIGVPVILDRDPKTPLFSYFRQIAVQGSKGYDISHNITVISTQGVANVGQGGLLYEYTDKIINEKYREDLRREITAAALNSVKSQKAYIKENWKAVLDDYLQSHPEYKDFDLSSLTPGDLPYEMGDYMPVFLVDEDDNLVSVYDREKEEILPAKGRVYDKNGKLITTEMIPMFDEKGKRFERFDRNRQPVSLLVVFKIEPNPGAGLWRPHNDQLPEDRKGEGVYIIFSRLGERAKEYKKTI